MTKAENLNSLTLQDSPRRQRVSKKVANLKGLSRTQAKDALINRMQAGSLSQGQTLKQLRISVLGLKQEEFARLCKVSRKSLSDIENDKGNYSVNILNQVFRPFGLKVGLIER